jgi:hypothetical protein
MRISNFKRSIHRRSSHVGDYVDPKGNYLLDKLFLRKILRLAHHHQSTVGRQRFPENQSLLFHVIVTWEFAI